MTDLVQALEVDESDLAADVVKRMELADPHLYSSYGPEARMRTLEDVGFHFQHLRGALAVEDEEVFREYKRWLSEILQARNVKEEHLQLCFRAMSEALIAAYGDAASQALTYMDA
jgi:hypothetical protein